MNLAMIVIDEQASDEAIQAFIDRLKPGIREAIMHASKNATGRLAASIDINQVGHRVIQVTSSASYAKAVDEGTPPHIMWDLINRVVPLKLSGTTVFRKVSLESILKGKWRHPGTPGKAFVEKGAELARKDLEYPIGFRVVKPPLTVVDIG